ncbi:MAG TPA: LCP family protein [Gaiellaceae bacterium]|nr:LCP family protein [Gaiellaceae bacterium]
MRTTLKKRIGRGATVNGNGRAVLPPSVLGPMRRYLRPDPPQRSTMRLFGRVLGWVVVAIAVVVSGLAGGLYLYGHETLAAIAPHTKQVIASVKDLKTVPAPSEPAVALIAGYDRRMGADASSYAGSRSDTIMLVRADPRQDTLSLLSLPRDLVVPIYCSGNTVYTHDRINAAWSICPEGPGATLDTVEHLTGIQINYLITLDFHGFKLLVNKLHGVYMNVDRRYYVPPHSGYAQINLHPGYQKLDGGQALNFVRYRHTDSDIYRLGRQQLFLDALKSRLAGHLALTDIPKIIGAIKGSVEIARGGGGAPQMSEIQSYAGLAYGLPPGHLFRDAIDASLLQPYGAAGAELTTSQSVIDDVVNKFLHPDVSQPKRANDAALGRKLRPVKQPSLKPAQISTLVLNGTGTVPGLAANTTYLLTQQGYDTKTLPASIPANAPSHTYTTWVYYDPVQPNAKQAARELKPLFGANAKVAPLAPAVVQYAQQAGNPLTVIDVGTSFNGKLTPPPAPAPVQQHQQADVSTASSYIASDVAAVASKVPFRILVPTQIAMGSQLSRAEGVRAYKPAPGQHGLVLTFVSSSGIAYWQVEETTWGQAPILAHPTGHFMHGGRKFDLYTVGGHVHMVVLHVGKASYWVVNTLLEDLSNETMIAIAESLQPLPK